MAWQREQADRCSSCGTWPWEWDENPHAYHAQPYQCLGCLKLETERDQLRARKADKGMHVDLERAHGVQT